MAVIDLLPHRRLSPLAGLARLRAEWRHAARRRAVYRQTHAELSALNTRELADLDIARSDILRIAREAAEAVR